MKRRIIGIVAAIALASVGTFALVAYVQSAKDKAVADEAHVEVYVLSKTVPADTPIAEIKQSLTVAAVPKDVQVEGGVHDLDGLDDDLVAAVELQAGEQLLASRLVDGNEVTETDVPKGLQEVTVALDPQRAVGGELMVGDTVGVLLSFDPFVVNGGGDRVVVVPVDPNSPIPFPAPDTSALAPAEAPVATEGEADLQTGDAGSGSTPNMTRLTFHKVLITGVQFDQNDSSVESTEDAPQDGDVATTDEEAVERAPSNKLLVTLAVSSPQAEQVVFAAEFGHIWLTAENVDADENGTRTVTLGQAYEATQVPK